MHLLYRYQNLFLQKLHILYLELETAKTIFQIGIL